MRTLWHRPLLFCGSLQVLLLRCLRQCGYLVVTLHPADIVVPAVVEVVPSQHGLSDQMEEAAKEWFSVEPQDKVNYDVNIMTAQGPLGIFAGSPGAFRLLS